MLCMQADGSVNRSNGCSATATDSPITRTHVSSPRSLFTRTHVCAERDVYCSCLFEVDEKQRLLSKYVYAVSGTGMKVMRARHGFQTRERLSDMEEEEERLLHPSMHQADRKQEVEGEEGQPSLSHHN